MLEGPNGFRKTLQPSAVSNRRSFDAGIEALSAGLDSQNTSINNQTTEGIKPESIWNLANTWGIRFARGLLYFVAGGFAFLVIASIILRVTDRSLPNSVSNPSVQIPPEPQPTSPYLPPAIPPTAPATPPAAPHPIVTMYDKGVADRTAWENWFNGLEGDFKNGAFFWAGQRSLPNPGSCNQVNADFYYGCTAAKERLATADALRMSEPDYRRGWNAYGVTGTLVEPLPGANPGGEDYNATGRPIPLHSDNAASATVSPPLPSAQTYSPNRVPTPPKCFTVWPAVPPADCFAH